MKSIICSVVAILTLVCFALAEQAPYSVSVDYDSNPSSLQLRAQTEPNNTVLLTWRGDPTSPSFTIYESIGQGHYTAIAAVGPNVLSYTQSGFGVGVPYFFKVCDLLDPQTCSNEVRVRFPG
jgi:hypothetical protein